MIVRVQSELFLMRPNKIADIFNLNTGNAFSRCCVVYKDCVKTKHYITLDPCT